MTDFQDTRRWRDLARLIPQIIQKLQNFAGDSSRTSLSRASIDQTVRAIELMAADFGDILAVYWPDSYECPNWDHALMVIRNQNDPAGRQRACATAIHKLKLLQRQLETTSERKPQQPDQNPTGPGQLSAATGEADAGFLQNLTDSAASSLRGQHVEAMNEQEIQQVKGYAERVAELLEPMKMPCLERTWESEPPSQDDTQRAVDRIVVERDKVRGPLMVERYKKVVAILEDGWEPIADIFEHSVPQTLGRFDDWRREILGRKDPAKGYICRLEASGWEFGPDDHLKKLIQNLERKLRREAERAETALNREKAAPEKPEPKPKRQATHSSDYRSVHWYGEEFTFTGNQAACVKLLWEAYESNCPDIGEQTLLEAADCETKRLAHVFRDHPAWGKMIVAGKTKGTRRLQNLQEDKSADNRKLSTRKKPGKKRV